MKLLKSRKFKVALLALLILIVSATTKNVFGYEIHYKLLPVEETGKYLYRKQTAAYKTLVSTYRSQATFPEWVYPTNKVVSKSTPENTSTHSNWSSFVSIYEYFHKYQHSNYRTDKQTRR